METGIGQSVEIDGFTYSGYIISSEDYPMYGILNNTENKEYPDFLFIKEIYSEKMVKNDKLISTITSFEDATIAKTYGMKIAKIEGIEKNVFLMDYIPGMSLGEILDYMYENGKRFKNTDKLKIVYRIAYSISTIHKKCITHRDIKPDNIFIDHAMNPHLGDFGDASNKSMTSCFHGTIGYISPDALNPSRSTDLYSFGATLYHIVTLKMPGDEILSEDNSFSSGTEKMINDVSQSFLKTLEKEIKDREKYNNVDRQLLKTAYNCIKGEYSTNDLMNCITTLCKYYKVDVSIPKFEPMGTEENIKQTYEKGFDSCLLNQAYLMLQTSFFGSSNNSYRSANFDQFFE